MKITVTRALSQLSKLKDEVEREIDNLTPAAVQHGKLLRAPFSDRTKEVFSEKAKRDYQSLRDKIKLIKKLNLAIRVSNAQTEVVISGEKMTVEKAIILNREVLPIREKLLTELKSVWTTTKKSFDIALTENEMKIERMIKEAAGDGGDQKKVRIDAEAYVNQTKAVEIVDPLNLPKVIEELEKELSEFRLNVDFALSEVNAVTYIEVDM